MSSPGVMTADTAVEGRFRALFDYAPVGAALCDTDGDFLDVNPAWRRLLAGTGVDPESGSLVELGGAGYPGELPSARELERRERERAGTTPRRLSPGTAPDWAAGQDRRDAMAAHPASRSGVPEARPTRDGLRALRSTARLAAARGVRDPRWNGLLAALRAGRRDRVRVEVAVPAREGQVRWLTITVVRVPLAEGPYLLAHAEDTTRRHDREERLARMALLDGLTGLANRTLVMERLDAALARAARTGLSVGVVYLDLDGFKRINDTLGHEAGDALLIACGQRLSSVLRAGDTAGRLGGDEFLVVAELVADGDGLRELVRRIEQALAEPVLVAGREVEIGASLGPVLSRPGEDGPTVVRRSDAAMFAAKRARRHVVRRRVTRPDAAQLVLLLEQEAVAVPGPASSEALES